LHPAVEALLEVLKAYLARRGDIIVPTARASGQRRLKIAFRGLYRSMPEELGYARFNEILAEIQESEEAIRQLEGLGLSFVNVGGEWYLEAPLDLLERLYREVKGKGGEGLY
jgi:hypothetical protein